MMIVPICGDTVKTCLRFREPGCNTLPKNCLKWKVRVQRVHCPAPPPRNYDCQDSCWAMGQPISPPRPAPEVFPAIEYPAFDIDAEGRLCFYWDDKLLGAKPGRYSAQVYDERLDPVASFEIDLCDRKFTIDQATNVDAISHCEDCE